MSVERKGDAIVIAAIKFGEEVFNEDDIVKITYFDAIDYDKHIYIGRIDSINFDALYIKLDMSYDYHSEVVTLHISDILNCERFDVENGDIIN